MFHWDHRGDAHRFTGHSEVLEHIQDKRGWTDPELEEEWRRRIQILEYMRQNGIRDFKAVSALLHEYYRRPEKLLARIRDRLPTVHTPLADHTPVAPEALHPETDEVRPIYMDEETDEELDDLFQQPNAEDTWR